MAANMFATMLHKNCPKIIVILVYVLLEWILILFLLLNSLFSYMIAKFAKFFGIKPSCTWCSRLEHISNSKNPNYDHVCEAHGKEISNMSFCSAHSKLAESHNLCIRCSSSTPPMMNDVSSTVDFFTWMSENASSQGGEEARCSCCDAEILTTKVYPHQSLIFKPTWDVLLEYVRKHKLESKANLVKKETEFGDDQQQLDGGKKGEIVEDSNLEVEEWDSSQTTDDPFRLECNEDEESVYLADMLLQNAELMDSDRFICIELIDTDAAAPTLTNSSKQVEDDDTRFEVLEFDDSVHKSSRLTQDIEIDGAAAEEHEKEISHESSNREEAGETERAVTIEALYAELEEEREAAAEAARETMAMITKLQEEKAAMQMEALQYQRMMEEQAEYDQEALQLLNDLISKRDKENKQLQMELQIYRTAENKLTLTTSDESSNNTAHSIEHHDLDQEMEDISLAEFHEERVSILEEVEVLEGKLLAAHDDDPMAKKLLPLFDRAEDEFQDLGCDSNQSAAMMILIQEELGHVYERLQALEADSDFLKHCIRSMSKGNQGMALLQEILQHLRDLKSVQLCARNQLADIPLSDASVMEQDHRQFSSA